MNGSNVVIFVRSEDGKLIMDAPGEGKWALDAIKRKMCQAKADEREDIIGLLETTANISIPKFADALRDLVKVIRARP